MDTKTHTKSPSRRNFLIGMAAGTLTVAVAMGSRARGAKASAPVGKTPAGPILYRRTVEAERYYKTLYT